MQMLVAGSACHSNHQRAAHEKASQPANKVQDAARTADLPGQRAGPVALSPMAVAAGASGIRGYIGGRVTGGFDICARR